MDLSTEEIVAVVREAGTLAESERAKGLAIEAKGRRDFVTQADRAVERFLRARLIARLPGSGFLGEEYGGAHDTELLWIVDPIDGTTNYIRRIPYWCVSVALMEAGQLILGVIFAPTLGSLYLAESGRGASVNGRPLCREPAGSAAGLVNIGTWKERTAEAYDRMTAGLVLRDMDYRLCGSGALALAQIGSGELDGAMEGHTSPWDVAAGLLIARESGCIVSDYFAGDAMQRGNAVVAAAPGVEDQVFAVAGEALDFPVLSICPTED